MNAQLDAERYRFLKQFLEFRLQHYDDPCEPRLWCLKSACQFSTPGDCEYPQDIDQLIDDALDNHRMIPCVLKCDIVEPKMIAGSAGDEIGIPSSLLQLLMLRKWAMPFDRSEYLYKKLAPIEPVQYEVMRNLCATVDVFDAAGLPYFLDGGTLLGACRDGRVIEWDHDSDIGIFADPDGNYENYLDCLNENLPDKYHLIKTNDRWAVCRSEAFKFHHGCELWDWTPTEDGYENHMETSIRVDNSPVPHMYLDTLDEITLHGLKFTTPAYPREFIEADFRYDTGAIEKPRFREQAGRNARETRETDPRNEPMVKVEGKWVRESETLV